MKIEQIHLTETNILKSLLKGDIYLVSDNRNHRKHSKNSGRLTFRQLKNVDIQELMNRINRGEDITAVRVTKEDIIDELEEA